MKREINELLASQGQPPGVSQMIPPPTLTAADLLHAADMALYQAKKQGRNRTVPEAMEDIPHERSI